MHVSKNQEIAVESVGFNVSAFYLDRGNTKNTNGIHTNIKNQAKYSRYKRLTILAIH